MGMFRPACEQHYWPTGYSLRIGWSIYKQRLSLTYSPCHNIILVKYNFIAVKLSCRHDIATPNQFDAAFWSLNLVAVGYLAVMIFRLQLNFVWWEQYYKSLWLSNITYASSFSIIDSCHPQLSHCYDTIQKSLIKQDQWPPCLAHTLWSTVKKSLPTQAWVKTLT